MISQYWSSGAGTHEYKQAVILADDASNAKEGDKGDDETNTRHHEGRDKEVRVDGRVVAGVKHHPDTHQQQACTHQL